MPTVGLNFSPTLAAWLFDDSTQHSKTRGTFYPVRFATDTKEKMRQDIMHSATQPGSIPAASRYRWLTRVRGTKVARFTSSQMSCPAVS